MALPNFSQKLMVHSNGQWENLNQLPFMEKTQTRLIMIDWGLFYGKIWFPCFHWKQNNWRYSIQSSLPWYVPFVTRYWNAVVIQMCIPNSVKNEVKNVPREPLKSGKPRGSMPFVPSFCHGNGFPFSQIFSCSKYVSFHVLNFGLIVE